jgi:hypothetical protein
VKGGSELPHYANKPENKGRAIRTGFSQPKSSQMFRPNQTHSRKPRLTAPGHERFNVPATSQQLAAAVVSAVMDTGIL